MKRPPDFNRQFDLQDEFLKNLAARLEAGRKEYGNSSLMQSPTDLKREIEEELLDVAGWAFVLWVRVRHLETGGNIDEPQDPT